MENQFIFLNFHLTVIQEFADRALICVNVKDSRLRLIINLKCKYKGFFRSLLIFSKSFLFKNTKEKTKTFIIAQCGIRRLTGNIITRVNGFDKIF